MAERRFDIARLPGFATIAIAAFVVLYVPIFTLVAFSFNGGNSIAVWSGFSLRWYTDAWANEAVKAATIRSLVIASSAAILATTVATMAATNADLIASAASFNNQAGGFGAVSKYVKSVQIDDTNGEFEVVFNEANVGAIPADSSLIFTPYQQLAAGPVQLGVALGGSETGTIDWGCSSDSNLVAGARGLPRVGAFTTAALPAKFAPGDCR